ncbi:NAD(P)H-dependent oxidoreductase [candidate division WOR-3 bacterium]|nr:NAD(P)H-dependent oxidoreductase [candidate division WOR-3 bacterium]
MYSVLVLEGSPRVGNTALVTDWVLAGMGRGTRVERVRVCDLAVHECQECFTCSKTKTGPGCEQEDDMVGLHDKIVDADLVLWTSPIFCWGITGQLKVVLDRCFALLTGEDLLKGSKWALVLTAGGDHFDGADLVVQMFSRLARFGGIKYVGQHVVAPCPDGAKLRRNKAVQEQARSFGRTLAAVLKKG